jgi:hypothetical protein
MIRLSKIKVTGIKPEKFVDVAEERRQVPPNTFACPRRAVELLTGARRGGII